MLKNFCSKRRLFGGKRGKQDEKGRKRRHQADGRRPLPAGLPAGAHRETGARPAGAGALPGGKRRPGNREAEARRPLPPAVLASLPCFRGVSSGFGRFLGGSAAPGGAAGLLSPQPGFRPGGEACGAAHPAGGRARAGGARGMRLFSSRRRAGAGRHCSAGKRQPCAGGLCDPHRPVPGGRVLPHRGERPRAERERGQAGSWQPAGQRAGARPDGSDGGGRESALWGERKGRGFLGRKTARIFLPWPQRRP